MRVGVGVGVGLTLRDRGGGLHRPSPTLSSISNPGPNPNPNPNPKPRLSPSLPIKAGCTDAGHFILELQCYPQLYANFLVERRQSWDEEPLQEVSRNPNPNPNPP